MAEHKFDNAAEFASAEWYSEIPEADHLNQPGHDGRLHEAARLIRSLDVQSWIDYGCGNGGLLSLVPIADKKGYDLIPANVDAAQRLGRPVAFRDFVNDQVEYSDLASLTEVLEHLEDPHSFLRRLDCRYLFATVPNGETPDHHYEFHLWGWDREGFYALVEQAGFDVEVYRANEVTQTIIGRRNV